MAWHTSTNIRLLQKYGYSAVLSSLGEDACSSAFACPVSAHAVCPHMLQMCNILSPKLLFGASHVARSRPEHRAHFSIGRPPASAYLPVYTLLQIRLFKALSMPCFLRAKIRLPPEWEPYWGLKIQKMRSYRETRHERKNGFT